MKGTQIKLDFNVDGINKVIQEASNLEKKFEAVGDKISSQSKKVEGLLNNIRQLNTLLNGGSDFTGSKQVEQFSQSVMNSLSQAIEKANELSQALSNIKGVPSDVIGGLNNISKTSSAVINTSAAGASKSIASMKTAKVDQTTTAELEKALDAVTKLENKFNGLSNGKSINMAKIDPKNIDTVLQYANALSKLESVMNAYAGGMEGKNLESMYLNASEFFASNEKISKAFTTYEPKGNTGFFKQWQKDFVKSNKDLISQAESTAKEAAQQTTKQATEQTQSTAPIKVTVDKDSLTNDITTALQSKEYTIKVTPEQNIADEITKQLEGKAATINLVAGVSKGVASVNSQISDFRSAYDQYVGIVNSGKGSTASLLKQYPLLSEYQKGMDVEKTKSDLTGKFAGQITSETNKEITTLTDNLNKLSQASGGAEGIKENLTTITNGMQAVIPPDIDTRVLSFIDALETLKSSLADLKIEETPFIKTINDLLSKGDELKALATVLTEAQTGAAKSVAKEATKKTATVKANASDINTILSQNLSDMTRDDIEKAIIERSRLRGKEITDMEQLRNDMTLALTKQSNRDEAQKMYTSLQTAKSQVSNIHINEDDTIKSFNSATDAVNNYREALDALIKEPTVDNLGKVLEYKPEAQKAYQEYMNIQEQYAKTTQVNKIRDSVSKDINQNSKMPLEMAERYRSLQAAMEATYDSQGNKVAITQEQYAKMQSIYTNLRAEMQATGQVGNNLFTKLGTGLGARVVQFTSFYLSFYRVIQYLKQGIQTLEQFDTTLTKISYTMDVSDKTLQDMGNTMQSVASDLSAPLENVEKIYTVYANMKTNPKEIKELTKYTTILSNLAGIDASAAADDVQGVVQQFDLAASDTKHIVDVFNYISSNIAVDYSKGIEGLAEAVQGSGNVAKMAGLSFEQYGSIIAKVMEQTRMDGSRVSNALRTIMTRLSKSSSMDETVDNATLSKASEALSKIGIQVYTTAGEYREFDTIMTELAGKWDSLTDSQRENISFAIAATRQTAMLKAVLNNWTESMDLATEATDDNGSALKNNEKYQKSLAGRLQKIKTGLQNFAVDFLDTDGFDEAIKLIGDLTKALEFLGSTLGQIGSIGGILTARSVLSKKGAIASPLIYDPYAAGGKGNRKLSWNAPFSISTRKETIAFNKSLEPTVSEYFKLADKRETDAGTKYFPTEESRKYLASLQDLTEEEKLRIETEAQAGKGVNTIAGGLKRISTGSKIAASATRVLGAALSGLAVGLVMSLLNAGINAISEYAQRAKKIRDDIKQYNENAKTEEKDYNSGLREITSLNDSFMALNNGVDEQGNNISLTNDELTKYYEISNQVAELIPSLVSGYTEEGNAVISLTNNYKDLTQAYKESKREEAGKKNKKSIGTLSKGLKNLDSRQDYIADEVFSPAFRWAADIEDWIVGVTHTENMQGLDAKSALRYGQFLNKPANAKTAEEIYDTDWAALDKYVITKTEKNGKRVFDKKTAQKLYDSALAQVEESLTAVKNGFYSRIANDSNIDTDTVDYLNRLMKSYNIHNQDLWRLIYHSSEGDIENFYKSFINEFSSISDGNREDLLSLYNLQVTDLSSAEKYMSTLQSVANSTKKYKNKPTKLAGELGIDKNNEKWNYAATLYNISKELERSGLYKNENIGDIISAQGLDNYASAKDFYNKIKGLKDTGEYAGILNQIGSNYRKAREEQARVNFSKQWGELGGTQDGKKTQEALLELANAGRLTIDTFTSAEGADLWIKKIGVAAEDVIPKINQLADSAKQLGSLAGNVESLRTAYGEKRDEGVVGATTLSSMVDTFGKLDYWKQYEQIVGTKSSTLSEVKAASDKLLTEYVNTGDYLTQLSKDNKDYYISQLSDMGVANAVEVVNSKLQQQDNIIKDIKGSSDFNELSKGAQIAATSFTGLQNATVDELIAMANLGNISKYTQAVLAQLAMTKLDWSGLNAETAISKLVSIAQAAGVALSSISQLSILQSKGFLDKNGNIKKGATYTIGKGRNKRTYDYEEYWNTFLKGTSVDTKSVKKNIKNAMKPPKIDMSTAGIDSKNGSGSGKDKSKSSSTKQEFDWLDRRVSIITSKVDLLKSKLENLFSMKKKQNNLSKQIKEQTKLIKTYTKEVSTYGKKAGSIKLSSSLKKKVRQGKLRGSYSQLIQKYGEKTADKITTYQDWYDKKLAAKKNVEDAKAARRQLKIDKQQLYVDKYNAKAEYKDLASTSGFKSVKERNALLNQEAKAIKKSYAHQIRIAEIQHDYVKVEQLKLERENKLVELQKKQFDNVITYYDRLISTVSHFINKIEGQIGVAEAKGANADVNLFRQEGVDYEQERILNSKELSDARAKLKKIKYGTSEYFDALDKVRELEVKDLDIQKNIVESKNKIREAYEKLYNSIEAQIERINTEQDFGRGLLSNYQLFDYDTGVITNYGKAYSSSIVTSMYASRQNANKDVAELQRLQSYRSGANGVTAEGQNMGFQSRKSLDEAIDATYDNWQKHIKEISGLESDLFKFIEDSLRKEEDLLKKLIDKRKEELDTAKDLHDYQKTIQEKTKNINDIQRQISAYSGDTSQEGMSRLQQLQKQLGEAQDDLQETEYDKYIQDQKDMLDNLYQDYRELLEALLADFKNVVEMGFAEVAKYSKEGNKIFVDFLNQQYGYDTQYTEDGSYAGIQKQVQTITNTQTNQSGTQNDNGNATPTKTAAQLQQEAKQREWAAKKYTETTKAQVGSVFQNHTYKATGKRKSDFKTAINQYLFEHNDKKVLSNKGLEMMRYWLKLSDNSQIIEAINYLKGLYGNIPHVKGFAKGGMVGDVIKRNGDDGFATLKVGEAVLTPIQAEQFKKFVTALPSLTSLTEGIVGIKDKGMQLQSGDSYIDASFNFELPNVENSKDFLREIQNNPAIQKALQEVTVNQLNKRSRLGVKKIK